MRFWGLSLGQARFLRLVQANCSNRPLTMGDRFAVGVAPDRAERDTLSAPGVGAEALPLENSMTVSESGSLRSIAVYRFVTCDRASNTFVEHVAMATAATIRRLKGMADLPSRRLVSPEDLDCEGFWRESPDSAKDLESAPTT